jgi:two-component system, sensor histidine kinase
MTSSGIEPSSAAAAELQIAVRHEQLRMITAHAEFGVLAATAFAVLVTIALRSGSLGAIPGDWLTAWLIVKVGVAIPRLLSVRLVRQSQSQWATLAARSTIPLLALDGLIWGIGAATLMGGQTETWSLIAACICCVACVATFGLQVRLAATAAYVGPMIAPVSLALLIHGGTAPDTAALGLALLLALLLSTARRSEHRLGEVIELRFRTEQVSAERAQALALATLHSQAKDRFLAVVSHELRTPLHGILGLTRLTRTDLARTAATALAHYRLELIEDASVHLQRMVNDLLDISFMESGRLQLHPAPFHLLHELSLITETYTARAPELGVRFNAVIPRSLDGVVVGDSARLAQVLHNLLGNAFKFTPIGGTITLSVERTPGGANLRFTVRDTGPGVPVAERESIFEVFTQGSIAGSRPEGVGLGLAIARQLARAMDGDIVYSSDLDVGSTFVFTAMLPSKLAAISDSTVAMSMPVPKSNYAGLTIYVADDDELNALVHGSVVRAIGCDVEMFENGRLLFDRFTTTDKPPAAILRDWDMPVLDGRATALAIRRYEARNGLSAVPIIGLSANTSPSMSGIDAGMTAFLSKPCMPGDLAEALTSHIGRETSSGRASPLVTRPSWSDD